MTWIYLPTYMKFEIAEPLETNANLLAEVAFLIGHY